MEAPIYSRLPGLFFFFLVLSVRPAVAQVLDDTLLLYQVVSFGEKGFVLVGVDDPGDPAWAELRYYDAQEQLKVKRTVPLKLEGAQVQLEGALAWNGRFGLLFSHYFPGEQLNQLIFAQFSLPGLEEADTRLVGEAMTPPEARIPFGYSLSPDRNSLLFYSWSYALSNDPVRVAVGVYDRQMALRWSREYFLPYTNERFYLSGCRLRDDGTAFLQGRHTKRKSSYRPGMDEPVLVMIGVGMQEANPLPIRYAGHLVHDFHVDLTDDNSVIGAAFYRHKLHDEDKGILIFQLACGRTTAEQYVVPISKDDYRAAWSPPRAAREPLSGKAGFSGYAINYIRQWADSSLSLIAGQPYGDVLALRTTPDRKHLRWMRRVPKRQDPYTVDTGTLPEHDAPAWHRGPWRAQKGMTGRFSHAVVEQGDRCFLLFNDVPENYAYSGARAGRWRTYTGSHGITLLTEITPSGGWRTFDLSSLVRERNVHDLWPFLSTAMNDRRLILYGEGESEPAARLFTLPWEDVLTKSVSLTRLPESSRLDRR